MASTPKYQRKISETDRASRKRFLNATLVTCAAASMIGGAVHVVMLGANRMEEMRSKAGYDLAEEHTRIRAAGEEIQRQGVHEFGAQTTVGYHIDQVDELLSPEEWRELDALVKIPAGEFIMGTDRVRANDENKPEHTVTISEFFIDKYPVTNAQYARYIARTTHRPPLNWEGGRIPDGLERHPVTMVSWYDAKKYCAWAGKRLAKEAEWEKAARGSSGQRWPWGERMGATRLNTYYSVGSTTDVARYSGGASPYGVMDMAGNVTEWTGDDFLPYEGSVAAAELFQAKIAVAGTPQDQAMKIVDMIPVDARYKVLRGGSWKSDPFSTAGYHRNYSWPHYASDFFGFRCAADENVIPQDAS